MAKNRAGTNRTMSGARRTIIWLAVLFIALGAVLTGGALTGQASAAPKLALDLEGGTEMILAPRTQSGTEINEEQLAQAVEIIRQRVDGSGVAEAEISTQSGRNVVVSMPGTPSAQTRELIQASADMTFRPVLQVGDAAPVTGANRAKDAALPKPTAKPTNASDTNWITGDVYRAFEAKDCRPEAAAKQQPPTDPAKPAIACEPSTGAKYILGPVEVPGSDIQTASFGMETGAQGASTGKWAVNIQFNGPGTDKFRTVTQRLFSLKQESPRDQFAIVLDGRVLSAPQTNAVITDGKPQITGNFTQESAKALSEQLKYGALPISFEIQSEQQISATLGSQQLAMGIIAGLIGLALVCVYSLFQYRLLGFVTIASLVVAGVLTWLAIAILGWTANYRLSLAGVAGLIVAIGQTADSFIVYFERIRDELRDGRSVISAVDHGWKRAKRTVLASKAVNLLAALVLYFVAVGNVRGFAFTLGLTAIADLIVVFMFTHPTMVLLARTRFFGGGHRWSGLDPERLGAVPFYRGAGRFREPVLAGAGASPARRGRNSGAGREAERRLTIAERRAAEQGAGARETHDRAGSTAVGKDER
ncbi:protein translocase subunit SecD [Tersicoccus solisilvae]|uniref:Protein translocase subunit SecD n=1 Tax=Tersicoccus solisilvae TaxID=1882339 RepID=A0ABQ1NPW6_9MICC|nr:protein translocase subunit SecD [Tersicoccus solisilvae]GGC82511.1 protein translocase subunit SecD [Tersicoccus solisilvae]